MFILRQASQDDAQAIKALIHAVGINPMDLDWRRFILAVDEAGEMIGCGQVKPHKDGKGEIYELASIAVLPQWRNRGAARQIIEYCLDQYPGTLYLTCVGKMGPMYGKFGFVKLDEVEMPAYFRRLARLARVVGMVTHMEGGLWVMRRGDNGRSGD
jgi:N-acetylglutamate synthase-like GNAT family acetyltransferase